MVVKMNVGLKYEIELIAFNIWRHVVKSTYGNNLYSHEWRPPHPRLNYQRLHTVRALGQLLSEDNEGEGLPPIKTHQSIHNTLNCGCDLHVHHVYQPSINLSYFV